MLSWLFKKRGGVVAPKASASPAPALAQGAARIAELHAHTKAQQAQDAEATWLVQLDAARGDDAALLHIVKSATVTEIRLAAIEALVSEDALKAAERALRGQDRRVHRAAKRRFETAVAQREHRARAQALIASAAALAELAPVPANRLVALDRDWQALDAALLDPAQTQQFDELRERLNTAVREQGERQQRLQQEAALRAAAEAQARQAQLAVAVEPMEEPSPPPPVAVEPPVAAPAARQGPTAEQRQQLDALLAQAEASLAEGQLGAMQQHLQAIDAALQAMDGAMPGDTLRTRHQALLAERGRLKGWQQWGGGRARDDLTAEAEALARITLAAADPEAPPSAKLNLKAHADAINTLRKRWKELDRLGAPANQTLWHRFDAALQAAHVPVAAQQAALKAAREENLAAREALLATLDALPGQAESTDPTDMAAHWKEQSRALDRFHMAWRQLGPLEHTVPSAARGALQQRLNMSLERIEGPLQEARRAAEAQREQLIARAEALVEELRRHPQMRDAVPRLRELQAEWQQHAASLPLARAVEGALWARFRAASDALFAQRDAALNARDAELAANLAAREALLERLSALNPDTPAAEIKRTLADVERAWRQAVEVPRAAAATIDARFRDARAAALQWLNNSAQRRWQTECDTLVAKLTLCEERESDSSGDEGDFTARWAALSALPPSWERAMTQRWSAPAAALSEAAFDDLLLQLEAALDLPATPEQQSARRQLKLRAMKDALEGRSAASSGPAQHADWLAAALRQRGATTTQRDRLRAIVAALRQAPPGSMATA